jgi:DNA modification methylase
MARTPEHLAGLSRQIKFVPLAKLKPLARNPRRGHHATIRESLRTHGQYQPLVVRQETDEILVGNNRYAVMLEEGYEQAAIIYRSVPSDEAAAKIAAIDNRSSDLATYDEPELAALLEAASSDGDLTGTGYSAGNLEQLLEPDVEDPDPPPTPAEPTTRPGDVVELGRHRVVCGDARDADAYTKALDGERADLLLTDPPYGVDLASLQIVRKRTRSDGGRITGDEISEAETHELHRLALELARANARPGAPAYLFYAANAADTARSAFNESGWRYAQTLVWVKQSMVLGRQDYQWRHEPILYGWAPGRGGHRWFGGFNKTTVLEHPVDLDALDADELRTLARRLIDAEPGSVVWFDRPHRSQEHPTMKPVDLLARLIRNSSKPGDRVLDPFGGSGSTLLAAEQTDRTAALIEYEPAYVDLIADRYEELTGERAKRPRRRKAKR